MKTSVVLSTFNGIHFIEEQLESIRYQTMQVDEVIIVDDCSTDGTYEYITDYIKKNDLMRWECSKNTNNIGWKRNFRKALEMTRGDIVFLCDQDDIWENEKVELMYGLMQRNQNIELIATNYNVKYESSKINNRIKTWGVSRNRGNLKQLPLHRIHMNVLRPGCTYGVRRNLIQQMLTNDIEDAGHDAMLWRYAAARGGLYLLQRTLIDFRRHESNASNTQLQKERKCVIKQIDWLKYNSQFFLDYLSNNGICEKNQKILRRDIKALSHRKNALQTGRIIDLLRFQLFHFNIYTTVRNLALDWYVTIKWKTSRGDI